MLVPRLLIQYVAQAVGLMMIRKKFKGETDVYRMPLYPLPVIVTIVGFAFCFFTTDNWLISGKAPFIDLTILHTLAGVVAFLIWSRKHGTWPCRVAQRRLTGGGNSNSGGLKRKDSDDPMAGIDETGYVERRQTLYLQQL